MTGSAWWHYPLAALPVSGAAWWVQHVHLDPSSGELQQYLSLALLALAVWGALKVWAPGSYSHTLGLCAALFTLMWGRVIFCGYLYYDEVHRVFSIPPVSRWLITPVNDHLTPLMWPLWAIQYQVLGGEYWAIALSHYCFGVLAVCGLVRVIQVGVPGRPGFATLGILFAALSTLSARIWIWKGCGDSPVIALALFAWLYYHCIRSEGSPSKGRMGALFVLYLMLTLSCSAITLGFVYLLPLLMVERFRTRRFLALLAGFFCLSAGYWLLRMQLVSGMRQHQVSDILGAFAKVWFSYSGGYLFSVLLALIALSGPLLFIRQRRWLPLALWATGSFMYGLGVLQLWGARGLVWSLTPELTEYHMLLPYAGISLLAGVSIAGWNLNWNLVGYTLAGALAVFYLHRTGEISEMAVLQSQAVIKTRAAFFLELKQLLDSGAALPDKSVGKMSYLHMKNMDWTEIKLFTDKEMLRTYGAPEYFNLQTLSYVYGGHRYDFLPADTPPERLDPAARQFVQKYWPAKPRSM